MVDSEEVVKDVSPLEVKRVILMSRVKKLKRVLEYLKVP